MNSIQKSQTMRILANETKFTAVSAMRLYHSTYQETELIDWHEFSNFFDQLHTLGILKVTSIDNSGREQYDWDSSSPSFLSKLLSVNVQLCKSSK